MVATNGSYANGSPSDANGALNGTSVDANANGALSGAGVDHDARMLDRVARDLRSDTFVRRGSLPTYCIAHGRV